MRTLDALVERFHCRSRRALERTCSLIAAIIALLISTIGVYGVTAATTSRSPARAGDPRRDRRRCASGLIRLVVRQGLIAAVVGIVGRRCRRYRRVERARICAL